MALCHSIFPFTRETPNWLLKPALWPQDRAKGGTRHLTTFFKNLKAKMGEGITGDNLGKLIASYSFHFIS